MTQSRTHRSAVAALAISGLLIVGCANDPVKGRPTPSTTILRAQLASSLQPFDACADFLDHVRTIAADEVTAYGLGIMVDPRRAVIDDVIAMPERSALSDGATAPTAAPASAANGASQANDSTGTNNQEVGVDEPDLVKIVGDRIVTVHGADLVIATIVDGAPTIVATVPLGEISADRLLIVGDRAFVLGWPNPPASDVPASDVAVQFPAGAGEVVEVDLSGKPMVTHRGTISGSIVDARIASGTLRLVVSTTGGAGLPFVYPDDIEQRSEQDALSANRAVVAASTADDWLPTVDLDGATRQLVTCDQAFRPAEPAGVSTLSVVSVTNGLDSMTATGVLADGQITYASNDHLYVATNRWTASANDNTPTEHTDVHEFALPAGAGARYEASGRIEGTVLNQYSMSESNGDLRIATTTNNDSSILVLRRDGQTLHEVGGVAGLGPGETIQSVRYVGDVAYVVTFRQTDPFYVVSLADPTAPKKLGELKVPGFSAYLHPVGDHLVLGVGSDATESGRVTGAKLSLYDTSDPTAPKEVATWTDASLSFQAASDPHAFTWDADRSTAYLPYSGAWSDDGVCSGNGVMAAKITAGGIDDLGRVEHPAQPDPAPTDPAQPDTDASQPAVTPGIAIGEPTDGCAFGYGSPISPMILRALVVGDRLVTVSDAGIGVNGLGDLASTGFVAYRG